MIQNWLIDFAMFRISNSKTMKMELDMVIAQYIPLHQKKHFVARMAKHLAI